VLRERADVTISVLDEGMKRVKEDNQRNRPSGENEWIWKPTRQAKGIYRVVLRARNVYRSADFYRRVTVVLK
jgi:hypothetical protein